MSVLLVTGAYDREIRFWEPNTGQCYRTIRYPDGQVNRLRFSPDRQLIHRPHPTPTSSPKHAFPQEVPCGCRPRPCAAV